MIGRVALDDDGGLAAHLARTTSRRTSALPMVAESATKRTADGRQDEHLFPHSPAKGVLEVVNLVEDDEAEVRELVGLGEQHVAQHLGGHDDDVGRRG